MIIKSCKLYIESLFGVSIGALFQKFKMRKGTKMPEKKAENTFSTVK
jgi:hypothetical protein